jgi:acylphosphatase
MMIRATLIISGDVQGAGYRAFVMDIARKTGLVGFIENMPDGTVKVVCEGEKNLIEKFVSGIKMKTEIVEVEDIQVEYSNATGEFKGKGFDIKVEESFKGMIKELFRGYVTSEKYFNKGFEKQDKMNQDMNKNLNQLNNTLTGFRDETKTEFQTIKTDYGKISQDLGKAVDSINTIAKSIERLAEAIAKK